jgi:hypothetical protein
MSSFLGNETVKFETGSEIGSVAKITFQLTLRMLKVFRWRNRPQPLCSFTRFLQRRPLLSAHNTEPTGRGIVLRR